MDDFPFHYQGFGCHVVSTHELLSLPPCGNTPPKNRLQLHFRTCPYPVPEHWDKDGSFFRHNHDEFYYIIPDLACFRLRGDDIWVEPVHGLTEQYLIEAHLFGPVIAAALQRLGHLTLHANAVTFCDQAILLCGWPGIGKSTLAHALCIQGANPHSDDVCAVLTRSEGLTCAQGLNHIKLMPDVIKHFALDATQTVALRKDLGKRVCANRPARDALAIADNESGPSDNALIRHVVILERSSGPRAELLPLKGTASFQQVKGQLFRPQFLPRAGEAGSIAMLIALTAQARIWQLRAPFGLAHIDDVAALLINQIAVAA